MRTEKERKRINCKKQNLTPKGTRGNTEMGEKEKDGQRYRKTKESKD